MQLSHADQEIARSWLCRTLSPYWSDETPCEPPEHLWPEIIRLSDVWLVAPRLYQSCRGTSIIPEDAEDVLLAVADFATVRSRAMRAELEDIIRFLNEADLEPVVFKGAEWLMGHYAPHAPRLMADLDLWFPTETEQRKALKTFEAHGYAPGSSLARHDRAANHHFPPLHREGAIARVELHHRLIRHTLAEAMDLDAAAARLGPVALQGLRYRRLAAMDGVTIAFLQSGRMSAPPFETRKVAVAKWLDFMDRFRAITAECVVHPGDIGILGEPHDIDIQLLTALSVKFGFPYAGRTDSAYIDTWVAARMVRTTLAETLWQSLTWRNLQSPAAWLRFVTQFPNRVRGVRGRNAL